jgi:hypothetical protein
VVKRYLEVCKGAGINVDKILFVPEGLAQAAAQILKVDASGDLPAVIVNIDENFADFVVSARNKPVFVRSIPVGAAHIAQEGEKAETRFTEEVKKSLEVYHSEYIEKTPSVLILTGAVQELKGLENTLGSNIGIPVKTAPYLRNLLVSREVLKAAEAAKGASFLNIISAVAAQETARINLMPEEVRLRESVEERGKDLIKTGVLILTVFVLILSLMLSKIYFKSVYLNALKKKYVSLSDEAKKLEGDFTKLSLMRSYLLARGYPIEVLSELYTFTPEGMELNNIRFSRQDKFTIGGTAESMPTVFDFIERMKKSKYFKEVKTKYTTNRKDGSRDVGDFEIIATLGKEVK